MEEGGWFETTLARVFGPTPFLKGNAADYGLALIFAILFPTARIILDKTLFEVPAEAIVQGLGVG